MGEERDPARGRLGYWPGRHTKESRFSHVRGHKLALNPEGQLPDTTITLKVHICSALSIGCLQDKAILCLQAKIMA